MTEKNMGNDCCRIVDSNIVTLKKDNVINEFQLDRIYDSSTSQEAFYNLSCESIVKDFMNGFNTSILAYGQAESGKSYSLYGNDIFDIDKKGVVPRAM